MPETVENIDRDAAAQERACTLKQVAERMHVSLPFLYSEIRAGRLRVVKFGRATRVFESDIRAWIAALRVGIDSRA